MNKTLSVALLSASTLSFAFASGSARCGSGFYVGAGVGYSHPVVDLTTKPTSNATVTAGVNAATTSLNAQLADANALVTSLSATSPSLPSTSSGSVTQARFASLVSGNAETYSALPSTSIPTATAAQYLAVAQNLVQEITQQLNALNGNVTHRSSAHNFTGALYAGYGMPLNNGIYFGAELSVGLTAGHGQSVKSEGARLYAVKQKFNYGGAVQLGAYLNPSTVAYLALGVNWDSHRFSHFSPTTGDGHRKKTIFGLTTGLGLRSHVSRNVSLGVEHTVAWCGNKGLEFDNGNSRLSFTARNHRTMVRVAYHF